MDIDNQLQKYREEQRRKHDQVAQEGDTSHDHANLTERPPHVLSTNTSPSIVPPSSVPSPSAPPYDEDGHLYPTLTDNIKELQEKEDERLARELEQERESERLAREFEQEKENERLVKELERENEDERLARELQQENEDERLARELQQEEVPTPQNEQAREPAQPQPPQGSGIMSTLTSIGRGLYNAYTTYNQAHQTVQQEAEQQTEIQRVQAARQRQQDEVQRREQNQLRRQMDNDEALARQMQEDEQENFVGTDNQGNDIPRVQQRPPLIQFRRVQQPFGPFGYVEEDEDIQGPLGHQMGHPLGQPSSPLDQLRFINSLFRSAGANTDEPLMRHLHEMMLRSRHPGAQPEFTTQRYMFPGTVFNLRNAEELPPHLQDMMHGQTDTSYEGLLDLAERMQPVSRGASAQQIDQLPTRTFEAGGMPAEMCKCGICLAEYEPGEELTSLPCLHSFHKECISHWLEINKICPVCRAEIVQQPNE